MALDKYGIARRIAQELRDGTHVTLGIGTPTLVANYIPEGNRKTACWAWALTRWKKK